MKKFSIFLIIIAVFIAAVLVYGYFSDWHKTAQAAVARFIYSVRVNSGLVGYWSFDGPTMLSGVASDISGNGNTGYQVGGISTTTQRVPGMVGQALKLDGSDDYINGGTSGFPTGNNAWTFAFWINFHTKQSGQKLIFFYGFDDTSQNIFLDINNGTGCAADKVGVGNWGGADIICNSTAVTYGRWYHIVVTHTSAPRTELYFDGASVGSQSTTNYNLTNSYFNIGQFDGGLNAAAIYDEFRVYDRALSAGEIQWLYKQGAREFANKISVSQTNKFTNGLVGHWSFDGPTMLTGTVSDVSGNGNTGYQAGGISTTTQRVPGMVGQALKLDGSDDYISGGTSGFPTGNNAWTFAFWTNFHTKQSGQKLIFFYGLDDTSKNIYLDINNGTGCAADKVGVGNWGGADIICNSTAVTYGRWYHIVVTHTSAPRTELYFDGASVGSQSTTNYNLTNSYFNIGRFDGGLNTAAIYDEFRVYDRALSAKEVRALYQSSAPAYRSQVSVSQTNKFTNSLVGYWSFDGPTMLTGVALDSSGNGKTGVLIGGHSTSTQRVPGMVGQALNFDGVDDYVSAGNVSDSVQSITFWMKIATSTTQAIIDFNGAATITANSGTLTLNNFTGSTYIDGTSGSTVTANKWHFVAVAADAAINASAVNIGNIAGQVFGGDIDEVRVYSRALSASEIYEIYKSSKR